jgi:hypothetical protein
LHWRTWDTWCFASTPSAPGERAIEPGQGTYHGALAGASLWPTGCSLLGLQVHDNRRAVDYLVSRPDVDPARLAMTGASGGGNQTLYAGATDERLTAVIPVCGIGTYGAYLQTACCVCEVNVGGAMYASTGDLLAMVAPRALLVISATRDALQFSVHEASKSIEFARGRFSLLGAQKKVRHVAIESGHDYNQPMREAMYGWAEKWLSGRGDGQPVPEPKLDVEEIATIRCYPDARSRPASIVTIPRFAREEGRSRLAELPKAPDHRERWDADAARIRGALREQILGGFPPRVPLNAILSAVREVAITTEPGLRSRAVIGPKPASPRGTALVISPGDLTPGPTEPASKRDEYDKLTREASAAGLATVFVPQPRATGSDVSGITPIAGSIDHTPAEWAIWRGRPLLGQWVWDIIRWLDLLDHLAGESRGDLPELGKLGRPYIAVGIGPMSLPVLLATALDPRIAAAACTGCLVSYVSEGDELWRGVPIGLLAPNILEVADVAQIAALAAPKPVALCRCVEPEGGLAPPDRVRAAFGFCAAVYRLFGQSRKFMIGEKVDFASLVS